MNAQCPSPFPKNEWYLPSFWSTTTGGKSTPRVWVFAESEHFCSVTRIIGIRFNRTWDIAPNAFAVDGVTGPSRLSTAGRKALPQGGPRAAGSFAANMSRTFACGGSADDPAEAAASSCAVWISTACCAPTNSTADHRSGLWPDQAPMMRILRTTRKRCRHRGCRRVPPSPSPPLAARLRERSVRRG